MTKWAAALSALVAIILSGCADQEKVASRTPYAIVYWQGTTAAAVAECTEANFFKENNERHWLNRGQYNVYKRGTDPIIQSYHTANIAPAQQMIDGDGAGMLFMMHFYADRAEVRKGGIDLGYNRNDDIARHVYECVALTGGRVSDTYWKK